MIGKDKINPSKFYRLAVNVLLSVGLAFTFWLFRPVSVKKLVVPKLNPSTDYHDALALYHGEVFWKDGPEILEVCQSILMSHGYKTEQAILFFHGFTNCPRQFEKLGRIYFEMGYNVFIPRLPLHGLADRCHGALINLTADDLKSFAENSYSIATGLGEKVTVVGLSGGGVLASWLAQFSSGLDQSVIIAPSYGLHAVPALISNLVTKMMLRIPNFYTYRNAENQASAPPYVQIKIASRAVAQQFRLGMAVFQRAKKDGLVCNRVLLVTNAADKVVNKNLVKRLHKLWEASSDSKVQTFEFEASYGLPHDLIDPNARKDYSDIVYPVLLELIATR
jgi:esterase/lipase